MLDSTADLIRICTLDGHVRDQVGHIAHLPLLHEASFLASLRHIRWILVGFLRIEVFQTLQCRSSADGMVVVRDHKNRVTIEVCTGKPFSDLRIDADRIDSIAHNINGLFVLVVDRELRDLKLASVRISNEDHRFAILIVRSIDLVVFQTRNR